MQARYIFGKWNTITTPLSVVEAENILLDAHAQRKIIANYPVDKVLRILDKLKELWQNPAYPLRVKAQEILPGVTGFSSEMIKLGLDALCEMLDSEYWRSRLNHEFGKIPRGPGAYYRQADTGTGLFWQPQGVLLHVVAGNVFLGAPGSFLAGVVTGNVNIIKMSSSEKVFMPIFVESLIAADPEGTVASSLAIIDVSSSQTAVIETLKQGVDGLVVWGGEEAVRAYRNNLPARTKIIVLGPKYSLAAISAQGILQFGFDNIASMLAIDMAIWDQNACTAPQVVYVEGKDNAYALAEHLNCALELQQTNLPAGERDLNTSAEIRKLRTVFQVAEARGSGLMRGSKNNLDWTIFVDNNPEAETSPLCRTIRLVPVDSLEVAVQQATVLRGNLQTVGLVLGEEEQDRWTAEFALAGAVRIVAVGQMLSGAPDEPHDGAWDLPQFVSYVSLRLPRRGMPDDCEFASEKCRQDMLNSQLRVLIDHAKKSPWYTKNLVELKIETTADLPKIPILSKREFEEQIQVNSNILCTGPWTGGYVSRSGGSTGEPKFSIYDGHDWEQMIASATKVLRMAGLEKGDRIANCFLAGDLYGSFVSFDHIGCRIGVTTFGFASSITAPMLIKVWNQFKVNAIEGVPSFIIPILREAKALEPSFQLEKVLFAGQPLAKSDRKWLQSELGVKRVSSVIGANDGGQIAVQCEHMEGTMHHLVDDFNYIEIVNDAGERVEDGNSGRILITSLLKYAFPLIRYEIGDLGRIIPGPCACGRSTRRLEFLGRSDNILCIGCMNLRYADFVSKLGNKPISAMQLAGKNSPQGEVVELRLESADLTSANTPEILELVIQQFPVIQERLTSGALAKFTVLILKPGSLVRNPRTGKIKEVLDER